VFGDIVSSWGFYRILRGMLGNEWACRLVGKSLSGWFDESTVCLQIGTSECWRQDVESESVIDRAERCTHLSLPLFFPM
jgi:hypothetical protein